MKPKAVFLIEHVGNPKAVAATPVEPLMNIFEDMETHSKEIKSSICEEEKERVISKMEAKSIGKKAKDTKISEEEAEEIFNHLKTT